MPDVTPSNDPDVLDENFPVSMRVLAGMSFLFHSCIDESELMDIVGAYLPKLLPGAQCGLYLESVEGGPFSLASSSSPDFLGPSSIRPSKCEALQRGLPCGGQNGPRVCSCLRDSPAPSRFCVPLLACGESFGLLMFHVEAGGDRSVFEPGQASLGRGFSILAAESIAMALHNIRLRKLLREKSVRDPLTGLYNRRYLEERLAQTFGARAEADRRLTLAMLDLDHFKSVNDRFGHDAGDRVLRAVGRVLQGSVRESDIACRIGGEEFVLVMMGAEAGQCMRRVEDIQRTLGELRVLHRGAALPPIGVSAGVAVAPGDAADGHSLLAAADAALYRAKKAGRGRIELAAPERGKK